MIFITSSSLAFVLSNAFEPTLVWREVSFPLVDYSMEWLITGVYEYLNTVTRMLIWGISFKRTEMETA